MKWDIYKKMNESQRLFWHYHFNDRLQNPRFDLINLLFLWLLMALSIFGAFIYQKEYLPDSGQFLLFVSIAANISKWVLIVYLFETIFYYCDFFLNHYREHKWLKKEGLK